MSVNSEVRQLLSVEDVAKLLQVSVRTIYDWRYRRVGPDAVHIGGCLRFDPDDVARWVAVRKAASRQRA